MGYLLRCHKWFGWVGITLLCSLGSSNLVQAQPISTPFVGLQSVYHWEFVGIFRDKVLNDSVSVTLTAISTYQVIGLGTEGFSISIANEGFIDWPAQSSNHSLTLITVLNTYGQENHSDVNPYERFSYSQDLILHSLGSMVSCEGPSYVMMLLSPLNLSELFGYRFAQEIPGEPSMYYIHDVNTGVGDVIVIWLGVHGEVVSRDDIDTRIGVLPALHITWSRTWTTFSPSSNNSQAFHFIYNQQTGFLISAEISGSLEWDAAEMVWNQTGSVASTNMHLPRFGFLSPLFLLAIIVMMVSSVIFLGFFFYIRRRYLR